MSNFLRPTLAILTILMIIPAQAVLADKGSKGNGNIFFAQNEKRERADNDKALIKIEIGDRNILSDYIGSSYRKHCPPGLAKKSPSCIPPGQAKKWRVGHTLPGDVIFSYLPRDILRKLGPVPKGYQYVQVDKDILLIGEATKKVIDAVTLVSAIGN